MRDLGAFGSRDGFLVDRYLSPLNPTLVECNHFTEGQPMRGAAKWTNKTLFRSKWDRAKEREMWPRWLRMMCCRWLYIWLIMGWEAGSVTSATEPPEGLRRFFQPPVEFAGKLDERRSPLLFADGSMMKTEQDWQRRREEILATWHGMMGEWPRLLEGEELKLEVLETTRRDEVTQHRVKVPIAPGKWELGYLLIPTGEGPFPAVVVPFYDPETSAGLGGKPLRDFAWQLAKRGMVTLCIGSPGGDARQPVLNDGAQCQPLSYLGYVAANAWQVLAALPEVKADRIGILGHSYGGKWAMFGGCLWEKYACGVWSDAGVVFDETRPSVNYWEPWYLGNEPGAVPKRGLITKENPRGGAYKKLVEAGHDLHELQALMAPRPFMVSGGSEDFPARWLSLNHVTAVYRLLGAENGVAMTNREKHDPNEESNEQIFAFLEWWLKR